MDSPPAHRLKLTARVGVLRWLAFAVCAIALHSPSLAADAWHEVAPGVLRTAGIPAGYALTDGNAAILIGAPRGADLADLKARGLAVEFALLTHHHRDSCEQAADWVKAGIAVRAGKKTAVLLSPEAVATFWEKSMPRPIAGRWPLLFDRFWGHWNYFVHPTGIAGVTFDLEDGTTIPWRGWRIAVMATPGHSRDHLAFIARRGDGAGGGIAFCGDAIAARGKLWAPFTMDWHHANADGQQAAADSLRKLAAARPSLLCPEHGGPIAGDIEATLGKKAALVCPVVSPPPQYVSEFARNSQSVLFWDDVENLVRSGFTGHDPIDVQAFRHAMDGDRKAMESYRNEEEKANLLYWQLTCESFYTPKEWEWLFEQTGYQGDYGCIYFE